MFNNWFKLNRCRNADYIDYKSNCLDGRNSISFTFSYRFSTFITRIYRICYECYNPSAESFLKISKERIQFFSEYANHSKKIIKIIKDGFNQNSNLFGSVDGLEIKRYQESDEIGSFELGKKHLMSGYRDIWKSIKKTQSEAESILNNLDNIKEEFIKIVISEIGDDFIQNYNMDLNNEIRNTYNENIFSEIYSEINNRINNGCRRLIRGPRWQTIIIIVIHFLY